MKYYHNLYLSDELKEKKKGIIYKLEHDKIQLNKYSDCSCRKCE